MNTRSLILGILLVLSPVSATATPWSLAADAGPMVWLLKEAPVSYAMNLSPAYALSDAFYLEGLVGIRHYSSEAAFTENAATSLPVMVGARYAYRFAETPISLFCGAHVGGFILVQSDLARGETEETIRFEPAGRAFLGADFHVVDNFSLGLNTALEVTGQNLFLTTGLGGRIQF